MVTSIRFLRTSAAGLAIVLSVTGCSSRLSHEKLLAESRGGAVARQEPPAGVSTSLPAVSATGGGPSVALDTTAPERTVSASGPVGVPVAGRPKAMAPKAAAASPARPSAHSPATAPATAGQGHSAAAPTSAIGHCAVPKPMIAIGAVGEQSGIAGQIQGPGPVAVRAWVAYVNANGGLYCHPLKYFIGDDGGDPSRNESLVQQFVEQDHVVAFVQNDAAIGGSGSVKYLTERRIPVIGTSTGEPADAYASPVYFPQTTSGLGIGEEIVAALGEIAVAEGKTKLASVTCIEAPLCSSFYPHLPEWAAKFGMTVVYRGQASLAQPDFTANCQAAKSAGAQVLVIGLDQSSIQRLAKSCAAVDFHPMFATSGVIIVGDELTKNPMADQMLVASGPRPWFDLEHPLVAEFNKTLTEFAPGVPASGTGMVGFTATQLFTYVAQFVPDDPTSQDFFNALWKVRNNDLGGITTPLTFSQSNQSQTDAQPMCFWIVQVKNKAWTSPNNFRRSCKPR
jgi:branched-chain amino acid transport system substrate-binding protein